MHFHLQSIFQIFCSFKSQIWFFFRLEFCVQITTDIAAISAKYSNLLFKIQLQVFNISFQFLCVVEQSGHFFNFLFFGIPIELDFLRFFFAKIFFYYFLSVYLVGSVKMIFNVFFQKSMKRPFVELFRVRSIAPKWYNFINVDSYPD